MTKISDIKIGEQIEWKFGLITRYVYRASEDLFEIDETCGGWISCIVDLKTMIELHKGEIDLLSLDWK